MCLTLIHNIIFSNNKIKYNIFEIEFAFLRFDLIVMTIITQCLILIKQMLLMDFVILVYFLVDPKNKLVQPSDEQLLSLIGK